MDLEGVGALQVDITCGARDEAVCRTWSLTGNENLCSVYCCPLSEGVHRCVVCTRCLTFDRWRGSSAFHLGPLYESLVASAAGSRFARCVLNFL